VSRGGQVVYEFKLIALNYVRGWFILDILAVIPYDLLYNAFHHADLIVSYNLRDTL